MKASTKVSEWTKEVPQRTVLKRILTELNAMEYHQEINTLVNSIVLIRKISYLKKCSLIVYMHLKNKGYPIVVEDMKKYSGLDKVSFLSLLHKNRSHLPFTHTHSLSYILAVYNRVKDTFTRLTIPQDNQNSIIRTLYNKDYFYNRSSPLITTVCICLYDRSPEEILQGYSIISSDTPITLLGIQKELNQLNTALNNTLQEDKYQLKREEKRSKIEKAIKLYQEPFDPKKKYSRDYESILIENLIKNNIQPQAIYDMTRRGMEYYFNTV
ncbi:hypothetical protein NEOKW01_0788 [Nematocida sp. AWRm80]|nr:hypothetical protein NEOKW01_0788 [Nematocida sp. AWRm80]